MRAWHDIVIPFAPSPGLSKLALVCAAVMLATGCASQSSPTIDALDGPPKPTQSRAPVGYTLTNADRELDCNVIRGRMKVALFHLKSERKMPQSTSLSRGLQGAAAGLFGGTTYGTDPQANADKETARLYAYNGLLKVQNCAAFDLKKELAPASAG